MKTAQASLGRVFVLRLEDGDTVPQCVEEFAAENNVQRAFLAMIGGVGQGKLVVGPKQGDAPKIEPMTWSVPDVCEAAAVGTIFPDEQGRPKLHMHSALGRGDETHTGCVRLGIGVWKICEVILFEILGDMVRKIEPKFGFEVLETG